MKRKYYFCRSRLDKKDRYFIWFSDEEDGVFLDSKDNLLVFNDLKSLSDYFHKRNLLIENEPPVFYDLDKLEGNLKQENFEIDCIEVLNIWNFFEDVSRSAKDNFDSNRKATKKIYEKIFWGNNLPVVTPEGKFYEPIWSKKEIQIIRDVLLDGLAIFRKILNDTDRK